MNRPHRKLADLLKNHLGNALIENSYFQMASTFFPSVMSTLFWILAARMYETSSVGYVTVLFSSLNILTVFASLGLGIAIIRFLPNSGEKGNRMLNTTFTIGGLASLIGSVAFIVGLDLWSPVLKEVLWEPIFAATFVMFSIVWTLRYLQSCVFLAKCKSRYTFSLNMLAGLVKLASLVLIVGVTSAVFGLFVAIGLGMVLTFLLAIVKFIPTVQRGYSPVPMICRESLQEIGHYTAANFVSRTLLQIQPFVLPIVVINALGAETSAFFYMAWAVGAMLIVLPSSIFNSLFAVASGSTFAQRENVIRSLRLLFALLLPAIIVLLLFADKILLLFGEDYSENGTTLMRLIALSIVPYAFNYLYVTIGRIEMKHGPLIAVSSGMTVLSLGLAYYLSAEMGLDGIGYGWLLGQTIVAIPVVALLWWKLQRGRTSRSALPDSGRPE
jgi:O-antigen/teichoic acid export membrane protein